MEGVIGLDKRTHASRTTTTTQAMTYEQEISATELAARLARGDAITVLDVREQWEYEMAHLEGSLLLPLSELTHRSATLDRNVEYIALCHHGMRSEMAASWLRNQGFTRVINLVGGIDAYSVEVDPSLERY